MKTTKLFFASMLFMISFILSGCNHFHDNFNDTPPTSPKNVTTLNGDNRVDVYWDSNPERDIAGYNIYYSYSYDGKYKLIGNSTNTHYIDYGANNGTTYYYAVTAYNFNGLESDLSRDVVYSTPRPEGFNQAVFDYLTSPNNSGYSFRKYLVVPYNDAESDFFFENSNGNFYIDVWGTDTDIQDMGMTNDIYDISYAPSSGWIPLKQSDNIKYASAIVGHTYVIWTADNNYAKIRIKSITNQRMVFDWSYQLVAGNRELKRANVHSPRTVPDKVIRQY